MDITSYIDSTRKAGYDDPSIRAGLERSGATRTDIDAAFAALGGFVDLYEGNGVLTTSSLFKRQFLPYLAVLVIGAGLTGGSYASLKGAASTTQVGTVAIRTDIGPTPVSTASGGNDTQLDPATGEAPTPAPSDSGSGVALASACGSVSLKGIAGSPRNASGDIVPYNDCFKQAYSACKPANLDLTTIAGTYAVAITSEAGSCGMSVSAPLMGTDRECPILPGVSLLDQLLNGC